MPRGARPPVEPAPAAAIDLGTRAYEQVAELVSFGPRHSGTTGWEQAVDHIVAELREAGLTPVRDRWVEPREKITFENVSAVIRGQRRERIVLACHHDTKICEGHPDPLHNFPFVGANDSASGVGLLLELARDLAQHPLEVTVEVVFFDGEESLPFQWDVHRALFGSRRYVKAYQQRMVKDPKTPPILALVLLDMVGAKDLSIDEETLSTRELRELLRATANELGHGEWFFEHRLDCRDDHVPFLEAGIPAIDLIDIYDNPQWHTPDDTLEHISARSLQIVGEVVWALLPRVAALYLPRDE